MSFRLFIYYCAVCAGWAALLGWGIGLVLAFVAGSELAQDLLWGLFLGLSVAMALGITDAVWNLGGRHYTQIVERGLLVGLLGGAGGLLGAAIGHFLYSRTNNALFQLVGWTLVGLLIGVSVGVFDYLARLRAGDHSGGGVRKLTHGALGGSLGGLVGAILFVLLKKTIGALLGKPEEQLLSDTAVGFAVLGGCIGLFIGLAQVILKEAWIKVEAGRRPGREMILSRRETSIGRAESCDVGLFGDPGVERIHARIIHQNDHYVLADAGTPGGTYLNNRRLDQPARLQSGDAIRVGNWILRFGERQKKVATKQ